jgi:hypothetical protein
MPQTIVKIHLLNYKDILKPRGSMKKESLGLYIKEKMTSNYEHFTNPEYGDNPDVEDLIHQLGVNAITEVMEAIRQFENEVKQKI